MIPSIEFVVLHVMVELVDILSSCICCTNLIQSFDLTNV